jgi:hypothetical protein
MPVSDRLGLLGTFCALLPVTDEDALRAELGGWRHGEGSPLAQVPGTHFARFVVLPGSRRESAAQPAGDLPSPLLLFSAFFDGDAELWLEALCAAMPDAADRVWRHCAGHPGHPARHGRAFRRWLLAHRAPATAVFGAYPDASVADVREALAFRERFRAFALDRPPAPGGCEAFLAFAEEQP